MSLVIAALIITGGLGFIVISDVFNAKLKTRFEKKKPTHLSLHSTIVLLVSAVLPVLGTVLFLIMEYTNTLDGLNFLEKLNASFFQSASMRTAGFASVNVGAEHDITKVMTILFMFIGASPASTGGGIKTTTFVVLAATVISVIRGHEDTIILKRRIDKSVVYRALAIVTVAMLVVVVTHLGHPSEQ